MNKLLSECWDVIYNPIISKERKQELLAKLFIDGMEREEK